MADFLSSLGTGLQNAGGILSDRVFDRMMDQRQFMQQATMQRQAQIGHTILAGIQNGTVNPNDPQVQAFLKGMGLPAMSASPQAKMAQLEVQSTEDLLNRIRQAQQGAAVPPSPNQPPPAVQGGLQPSALAGGINFQPSDMLSPLFKPYMDMIRANQPKFEKVGDDLYAIPPMGGQPQKIATSRKYEERDLPVQGDMIQKQFRNGPDDEWKPLGAPTHKFAKQVVNVNAGDPKEGLLTDEEANFMARQAWTGDTSVFQNLGRGKQGAQNIIKVRRAMMEYAKENGKSPEELAAKNAEFFGVKAGNRTLGTRTANIEMAVTEAQNIIPIALSASDKVDRTKYPNLNAVFNAVQKGTGDENVVRLASATNALINVYSRALSPTGTPTVSDKEHAREIIDKAFSQGQYRAALDVMTKEMEAARKSPGQVREGFRSAVTGKGEGPAEKPKEGDVQSLDAYLKSKGY